MPPERRAHSNVPPSSRIPVRFEFGFTAQERAKSMSRSVSVRKSGADCGPRIARISHSCVYSGRASKCTRLAAGRADRQPVAGNERASFVPAERPHRVRRARAEHRRHVDPAGDGDIEPEPWASGGPDSQLAALVWLSHIATSRPSTRDRRLRAGDRDRPVEAHREVSERDLEPGRLGRVADDQVRRAEGEMVHRPRREEPLREQAAPPRVVLDGRLDPGLEDLDHGTGVSAAAASRRARTALGLVLNGRQPFEVLAHVEDALPRS